MKSRLSRSNLPPVKVILKRLTNREISKHTSPQLESLNTIKIIKLNASLQNAPDKENQPPTNPTKPKQIVKKLKHQSVQTVKEDFVDYRDIKRFIFYCCDKCDFKAREGSEFKSHLATEHEEPIKKDDPSPSHSPPHAMFTDDENEADDDFIWETTAPSSSFNQLPTIQDVQMFEEIFREEETTLTETIQNEGVEPMEHYDDKDQVDLYGVYEEAPKKPKKKKTKTPIEPEEDDKKYEGITFADLVTCKKHYCLFCYKPVFQLHRHLWLRHRDKEEVKKLKKLPPKEASLEKMRLKLLGDHLYNVKVLEAGSGTLMTAKNPGPGARVADYGPCPHCKGWYLRRKMKEHLKICHFNENKEFDQQPENFEDISTTEYVTLNESNEVNIDANVNVDADANATVDTNAHNADAEPDLEANPDFDAEPDSDPDFDPNANADVDARDDEEQHEGITFADFTNFKHYCLFCSKPLTKIHRHLGEYHSDEEEVKKLKTLPAKEASLEKMRLKLLGDHQNNVKVLKAGSGTLMIARRSKWYSNVADYGPCPHCKGWYLHHGMKGHLKTCHFNENKDLEYHYPGEPEKQPEQTEQLKQPEQPEQPDLPEQLEQPEPEQQTEEQPEVQFVNAIELKQEQEHQEHQEGQTGNQDNTTQAFVNLSELKQEFVSAKTNRKPLSRLSRFACVKCFIDFPNILRLLDHLEEHRNLNIFLCEDFIKKKCLDTYNNLDEFKKHVKTHFVQKKQEYKKFKTCLVCSETFDTNEDFVEHIDEHAGEELKCNRFYGTRCYFTGESVSEFKDHFMGHFKRKKLDPEVHQMESYEIFCRPCKTTLRELNGLTMHLKLKHPEQLEFKCHDYFSISSLPEQCQNSYLSYEELIEHIKLHLDLKRKENPYRCPKCQKVYETRAQFVRHDRRVHEGRREVRKKYIKPTLACEFCGKIVIGNNEMKFHKMAFHTGERPHVCDQCGKSFVRTGQLNYHIKKVHSDQPKEEFPCQYCGRIFNWKESLKNHIEAIHIKEDNQKCEFCDYVTNTSYKLRAHIARLHTISNEIFKCGFVTPDGVTCEKTFNNKYNLKSHQIKHRRLLPRHDVDLPFKCELCPRSFPKEVSLQRHVKNFHQKVEQVQCPLCFKEFPGSVALAVHLKLLHKGIRPFKCNKCEAGFLTPKKLQKHVKNNCDEEREYKCEPCNTSYGTERDLKVHMNKIHNICLKNKPGCKKKRISVNAMDSMFGDF